MGQEGDAVLTPTTEEDLADIVRGANGPLSVRGGGTRGPLPEGEAVTTTGLTGITLYEPGALTIVARAGTPMEEIEAALASENQRLPFEPMDHRVLLGTTGTPTIGGAVAMNVSGPRRVQAGACRDSLIGVRFVDGTGTIVKNGGRVMKNVTGYDLVKLLAGSRGSLGVLTEVSFKVLPSAATEATLVLDGLDVAGAVKAMAAALSSPFEVNAAAHDPQSGKTSLRIEGLEGSVAYRTDALTKVLTPFGTVTSIAGAGSADLWRAVRDGQAVAGEGDIWRVHTRASAAAQVVADAKATASLLDWGGGLVWLRVPEGLDLRARLGPHGAQAIRVRGTGAGALPPEPPALAALTDGIRDRFDPRGLFKAGLAG
ncbi:FAD-binding protein [Jannaschia pohangensis]|uniref:Glycolate oxidase FAD binding subunit n=1 Tax=Jannaschia pohangensis TaxID=390807 RepID=A0A1I3MUV4_9RHOB|nr:FAD-binding protein [Jannaschia pohangensis]SFJ00721.1 glycolate oxidase FAD binding subunit [Jannaschia pohangensis]